MATTGQTLLLSDSEIREAFAWPAAIDALAAAYGVHTNDAQFPPRSMARGKGMWLRTLSGILPGQRIFGAKLIAASPANKVASYLIPLFDGETMALVALIDAASITGLRTAATSALAARRLCTNTAPSIALIGSGFEARTHLEAMARSGPIGTATVFSPRPASRQSFCDAMDAIGISAVSTPSPQAAIEGADLIICAARSRDESPTLLGEWLAPGATVVSIGSTLPEQRELDVEAIRRADMIVADMVEEVAHDTGDMMAATSAGVEFGRRIVSLEDVVCGDHPGRTDSAQIVIYKSVGAALQDLAVAALCVERALAAGLGTFIRAPINPVNKGK